MSRRSLTMPWMLATLCVLAFQKVQRPVLSQASMASLSFVATCSMPLTAMLHHAGQAEGWSAQELLGGAGALADIPSKAIVLCESDDLCGVSLYTQFVEGDRVDLSIVPRQHLMNDAAWRRSRLATRWPSVPPDSRTKRLRWILSQEPSSVRWEMGDVLDERLTNVHLTAAENPLLTRLANNVPANDLGSTDWLAGRGVEPGAYPRSEIARSVLAHALFNRGRLVAQRDLPAAGALWIKALSFDSEHAGSWTNLAVVKATEGHLGEAIVMCERAIAIDPDRVTAWRNVAKYRRLVGDIEGALAAEREVLRRTH